MINLLVKSTLFFSIVSLVVYFSGCSTPAKGIVVNEHGGSDYWKNYMENWFGKELIEKWDNHVTVQKIKSGNGEINIEVYDVKNPKAPTIIFSHGIAGYARVMLPFVMPLYESGYNIIAPDLKGYGYNTGLKGDFEWNSHVENLVDVVKYAKKKYQGKIILGGASMGGPLAYETACKEEVDGLVAWCLWDLSDEEFLARETTTKQFTSVLIPIFKISSRIAGSFRMKTYHLISYDTLSDSEVFNEMVKKDPQAGTHVTLRGVVSLVTQSKPTIPYEQFQTPILVVQPGEDIMIPKYYVKKAFNRMGSNKKKYFEMDESAHFPLKKGYYKKWRKAVVEFVGELSCQHSLKGKMGAS